MDNAIVGMPDNAIGKIEVNFGVTESVTPFFVAMEVNKMVRINGENLDAAGKSVAEYLDFSGYDLARVAVELNGEIIPKAQYTDIVLKDGDSVEIVSFVGGG